MTIQPKCNKGAEIQTEGWKKQKEVVQRNSNREMTTKQDQDPTEVVQGSWKTTKEKKKKKNTAWRSKSREKLKETTAPHSERKVKEDKRP